MSQNIVENFVFLQKMLVHQKIINLVLLYFWHDLCFFEYFEKDVFNDFCFLAFFPKQVYLYGVLTP